MDEFLEFYESWENYEQLMLNRIAHGEAIEDSDLEFLVREYEIERIDSEENDVDPTSAAVTSIIALQDKYFAIKWQQGLTERQPDYYDEQPYEVKCQRVGETCEWVSVE